MSIQFVILNEMEHSAKVLDYVYSNIQIENKSFINLEKEEVSLDEDIYVIGFDYNRMEIPFKIMSTLMDLEDKRILSVVCSGIKPDENYAQFLDKKMEPFLNDSCLYLGTYACAGAFSDNIIKRAKQMLKQDPKNKYGNNILQNNEITKNRPNQDDFEKVLKFVIEKVK